MSAGQKDKARQTYQKLLEMNPRNESAARALKKL
ncbi:hypothetical protein [Chryseobacterium tongliaoense]